MDKPGPPAPRRFHAGPRGANEGEAEARAACFTRILGVWPLGLNESSDPPASAADGLAVPFRVPIVCLCDRFPSVLACWLPRSCHTPGQDARQEERSAEEQPHRPRLFPGIHGHNRWRLKTCSAAMTAFLKFVEPHV
jgi:hypothetical protein